ncbi:hypothetical protein KL910_004455 [Ogataea haglerorum]|nr:hypothetical protein KL945_004427 [Ogataea haglerorum]KAG7786067.1 hypothetical protein KL910_004455 [Ogataea haglerorum]
MCRPDGKDDAPYNRNRAENHNHWPSLADDVGRPRHDHGAHYLHSITSRRVRVDVRDRIVLRLEPQVHVAVQLDGHNVEDERRGEQPDGLREKQRLHRVEGELLPRLPLDRVEVGYNQLFLVFFQPPRLGIVWSVRDRKVAIDGHRDRDNSVKNKQPLVRGEAVHTVHAAMQSALEVTREHVRERGRDLENARALAELRRGIPLAKKSNETAITPNVEQRATGHIILVAVETVVLLHAGRICVGQVGLVQSLQEVSHASVREDPEVDLEVHLSLLGRFVERVPELALVAVPERGNRHGGRSERDRVRRPL